MNQEKDALLEAFENPDMVTEPVQPAPSAPVAPTTPVAPQSAPSAPVAPATPVAPQPAPSAPVAPATPVAPQPAPSAPVAPATPVAPQPAPSALEVTNNTVTEEVSKEELPSAEGNAVPTETVATTETKEEVKDEPNFLKKNFKFILILCLVIGVFIFFLPKILSLLSGGKY